MTVYTVVLKNEQIPQTIVKPTSVEFDIPADESGHHDSATSVINDSDKT